MNRQRWLFVALCSVVALTHIPMIGLVMSSLIRSPQDQPWSWEYLDTSVLLIVCPMLALTIWRRPPLRDWNTSPSPTSPFLGAGLILAMTALISGLPPLLTLSLPLCVHGLMRQWLADSEADQWSTPGYLWMTLLPLGVIPQWEVWPSRIACHVAAWIGGTLLRIFGYPVVIDGTIVYTGGNANHVLDSCSGLTIFGSILYLGIVAGTLWRIPIGIVLKRVAWIMPLAVVGNASRVSSVSAAYDALGHPTILAHEAPSILTSLVCFVLLFGLLKKDRPAPAIPHR